MKSINELYEKDKPREKFLVKGASALKKYELLAILLGCGTKNKDVIKVSKEIIKIFEDDFEKLSLKKLTAIHGIGDIKAVQILSALELSKRFLITENIQIGSAKDVYNQVKTYTSKKQEYFICITLNGANHIIKKRVISIGTLTQTLVHPREVFVDAIADRAAGIIIIHNHPSGSLHPSHEDREVTKRLIKVSKIVGIELLDHIIISQKGYFSFKEKQIF